jgi:hypothetical protein
VETHAVTIGNRGGLCPIRPELRVLSIQPVVSGPALPVIDLCLQMFLLWPSGQLSTHQVGTLLAELSAVGIPPATH